MILRLRLSIAIFPWGQGQLGLGLGLNQGFSEGAIFSDIFLHFLEWISKQIKISLKILRLRLSTAIFNWGQGKLGLGLGVKIRVSVKEQSFLTYLSDLFIHFVEWNSKHIKNSLIILRLRLSTAVFTWGQGWLGQC